MAIEFRKSKLRGVISCNDPDRGLMGTIESNLNFVACDELTIADLEQILSKMKELQGGNDANTK